MIAADMHCISMHVCITIEVSYKYISRLIYIHVTTKCIVYLITAVTFSLLIIDISFYWII